MSPVDARLSRLVAPVEQGMQRMRAVLTERLACDVGAVSDMTDHIARFRGKQLRAALTLLAAKATGNEHPELPSVAAIVELIHLATLVHDDVLDGAEVRRRVASVNQRWDNQSAVLLGDFLYARAFHLATSLASQLASGLLAETTQRICAGEIEQAARRYDFELPQERYEAIAAAKTAELYGAACELGVRYPDGDEVLAAELGRFGRELGLAFQIVDDVLDVVGSPDVVGKSLGNDVDDGKVTLPVLRTYAAADEATRARIRDAYTQPGLGDRAARLAQVCDLEPGVDYSLARARALVDRSLERLSALPVTAAREALEELSGFVLERKW